MIVKEAPMDTHFSEIDIEVVAVPILIHLINRFLLSSLIKVTVLHQVPDQIVIRLDPRFRIFSETLSQTLFHVREINKVSETKLECTMLYIIDHFQLELRISSISYNMVFNVLYNPRSYTTPFP